MHLSSFNIQSSYPLQEGAFALTNAQYDQLISGQYILQNNQITANPNSPMET